MENINPTVVALRHREALAHAEASQLLVSLPHGPSLRARLASILVTLVARLDSAALAARQEAAALTPANPA